MGNDELIQMIDSGDHLYDKAHFAVLEKRPIAEADGNTGVFKAFIYKNSLRFSVLMRDTPAPETVSALAGEIGGYIGENKKSAVLLWYAQVNGFSAALPDSLKCDGEPHHFYLFRAERDAIGPAVDMKGLEKRRCAEDDVDACIDVMENLFTPFPDAPGSFRSDRGRIRADFLYERGGAELFYKGGELVGFCGHKDGHVTELCVRREFQGKGYGEVIVRSTLAEVREMGCDAELTVGYDNVRAIALYRKVGFKQVYEAVRIKIDNQA